MPRSVVCCALVLVALSAQLVAPAAAQSPPYGLGRPPTPAELEAWAISIAPDGTGLPAGSGNVAEGKAIFELRCTSCHGPEGKGGTGEALVGGAGSLASEAPQKTVASYWPYATTLFDYVRRAMPFDLPGTLSDDQVYAVVAYLLFLGGIVDEDERLDAATLPAIEMPNRGGFVPDPRPDVPAAP